ncbi:MAG: hypothetical protein CEO21_87 [Microgenomates group bacterium Gr01-1014_80]|nr:MAG: hypothetical protein CEO21_87 [Microgenomates group bacterium Gr01-1014_80]
MENEIGHPILEKHPKSYQPNFWTEVLPVLVEDKVKRWTPRLRWPSLAIGAGMTAYAILNADQNMVEAANYSEAELLVEGVQLNSRDTVRPGKYFPRGVGLRPLLQEFARAHYNRTGEDVTENLERLLGQFTGRFAIDPATGLCNGYSNYQALEPHSPPGLVDGWGIPVSSDVLDAVGTVIHYDDAPRVETFNGRTFTVYEKDQPIFWHLMFHKYLGEQGVPLVIDRSTNPIEVWTHPVDQAAMQITRLANGWIRVKLTFRGGNYLDGSETQFGPYREFTTEYEVQEGNVQENGRFIGGTRIRSLWRPQDDRFWGDFRVDGNVMTDSMVETYTQLAYR